MKKLILICAIFCSCGELRNYDVELTFCDNRPPVRITIMSVRPPSNSEISTYKQAVPTYCGYMNVCDVRVIKSSLRINP